MKEKFIRLTRRTGETIVVRGDQIQMFQITEWGSSFWFVGDGRAEPGIDVKESPSQIIELMEGA